MTLLSKIKIINIVFGVSLMIVFGFGFYLYDNTPIVSFYTNLMNTEVVYDVAYADDDNYKHKMDLYLPPGDKNFPVVVFVHGGYWRSGDRRYYQALSGVHGNIGTTLASQGIGVAVISYRLTPEADIDGQIDDVSKATQWVFDNISKYGGDPGKVFLVGHSAGGHLVSMVGLNPNFSSKLRGIVAMSSIFSIEDMIKDNNAKFNEDISYKMFGRNSENWHKYSPATYFNKNSPKMLIMVAENDFDYMLKQIPYYAEKLKSINQTTEFVSIPHYIHSDMVAKFGKSDDIVSHFVASFIKRNAK